jgi:maleate isomerase
LASEAVSEAMKGLGVQRIGLVTPFLPEANRNVEAYFAARGFCVVGEAGFSSAHKGRVYTARISEADVRDAFARVDTPAVEALVQVGTALACAGFVEDLEAHHAKPVIAVNTATYWLALREHGIADHVDGYGVLMNRH